MSTILFAYQKTRLNELITFVSQLGIVLLILSLNTVRPASIDPFIAIVAINALIPVGVWSLTSLFVYAKMHPELIPAKQYVEWYQTRTLLQTGLRFTILQLYGIALFFTDNVLIAYLFGADVVTEYSIINKYFSVLTLLFGMVLMPYWSAVAVTYATGDTSGTIHLMRIVSSVFLVLALVGIVLFLLKDYIIHRWTGLDLSSFVYVSVWLLTATLLAMFNNIFTIVLNSAGKLTLQVMVAVVIIVLNPILSVVAVKVFGYELEAIPVVNVFCLLLFGFVAVIQTLKVVRNRATGIWNR